MINKIILTFAILFTITIGSSMAFELTSPAFKNNGSIPSEYTCDGDNISPELNWTGVPEGTKSFALIMEDPDTPVGTFDHWVVFNIPANIKGFSKAMKELPAGALHGLNTPGKAAYKGPCPPDKEHRYIFRLFALDIPKLDLEEGATKSQVQVAIFSHIIKRVDLIGLYNRPQNMKK